METKEYIHWLKINIKNSQTIIAYHQEWINCDIKELQKICPHGNVVELPATVYSGIAKGYARRFCTICKLEESESIGFQKLIAAHKVLNDVNATIRLCDYMEIKEKS